MADNTDEEHLENPVNNQSENPPDEITPTPDTEDINPNQETENMEVHHHSHSSHGKKNWKSYFWEFLMLFLAVFCGFLAEYQLEHVIENSREKQYMQSYIYDLQNDTANLNASSPLRDQRINAIDSVFVFFETHSNTPSISGDVLRHIKRATWDNIVYPNTSTIDQLKNAGGLRLIRKRSVRDSIAAYDLKWQRNHFRSELYINLALKERDLVERMIKAEDMLFTYRTKNYIRKSSTESVRINNEVLNEYLNTIGDQKTTTRNDIKTYMDIKQSAERLITLIKKEYHLD